MDSLELLRASPLLSQLTEAELCRLRKRAVTKRWRKDEVIFRKGDTCDGLIVILSGSAFTVMRSEGGFCRPTGIFGRGDILGFFAVLDGGGRVFTAVAREPTSGLCLDRREFNDIVASRPELKDHIISLLCRGARSLYAALERRAFLDVRARLAGLLLLLHQRYAVADVGTKQQSLFFSQNEIAELLGFSREWVGRELVKLRNEGIVELRRSRLVVQDKVALEKLAQLGPYLKTARERACGKRSVVSRTGR